MKLLEGLLCHTITSDLLQRAGAKVDSFSLTYCVLSQQAQRLNTLETPHTSILDLSASRLGVSLYVEAPHMMHVQSDYICTQRKVSQRGQLIGNVMICLLLLVAMR